MLIFYHAPQSRSAATLWLLEELEVPYDASPHCRRIGQCSEHIWKGFRRVRAFNASSPRAKLAP